MSRYYNKNSKSRRERIGFYTAFAICLIAVCMAVYSTYNTVSDSRTAKPVSTAETGVAVNQVVTGVPATVPAPTLGTAFLAPSTVPTETAEPETTAATQPSTTSEGRDDALQTMLAAEISLDMPTKSGHVLRPYSKDSVYFKTINTWKPHTGADFDGNLGDKVSAMLNGEVTRVSNDKLRQQRCRRLLRTGRRQCEAGRQARARRQYRHHRRCSR